MKYLYEPTTRRYTPEAIELHNTVNRVLKPLFQEYIDSGYSYREISHILFHLIADLDSEFALTEQHRAYLIKKAIEEKQNER